MIGERIAGRMTSFWECSDELFEARNLSIQRDTITGAITGGGEGHETLRRECYFPVAVISLPVTGFEAGLASQVFQAVHSGKMV